MLGPFKVKIKELSIWQTKQELKDTEEHIQLLKNKLKDKKYKTAYKRISKGPLFFVPEEKYAPENLPETIREAEKWRNKLKFNLQRRERELKKLRKLG